MNLSETARLLTAIASFNNRTIGEADVEAWQSVLTDVALPDAMEAVKRHYAEHTEWMMPAHVRRLVRDIHGERAAAARATGWAPGQAGVPKDQAMPTGLRPSAVEAGQEVRRLALSDLPAAVADLVMQVRASLPEGSRESLMPRRVAWEREHAVYRRTQDAQPNPHYRPQTLADVDPRQACKWHEEGRYGWRWDCRSCNPGHPAYQPNPIVECDVHGHRGCTCAVAQTRELMVRRQICRENGPHDAGMHIDTCPDAVLDR